MSLKCVGTRLKRVGTPLKLSGTHLKRSGNNLNDKKCYLKNGGNHLKYFQYTFNCPLKLLNLSKNQFKPRFHRQKESVIFFLGNCLKRFLHWTLTVEAMRSAGLRSCVCINRDENLLRELHLQNHWNPHCVWASVSNWPFLFFNL